MMKKSELVSAVHQRLSDAARWTKGAPARRTDGLAVHPYDPDAQSWCLIGAMTLELHRQGLQYDHLTTQLQCDMKKVFREQYPNMSTVGVARFNDHPDVTHEGMLNVLDKVYTGLIERGE